MHRRRGLTSLLLLLPVLVGGLLLAPTGCTPADRSRRLVVGMELGSPPFEMTDPQGQPTGVSVDLARALARHLQRELVIENIAFDGLIPALKTGRIDLILSSMTRTDERAQSIDFSEPYAETGLCLLVARNSTAQGIGDLNKPGRTIAVKKGTTGHAYAVANLREARVLVLDQESAAVLEVIQGKAEAFIYDQLSVHHLAQRNPETTRALLQPFQKEHWAMGVRKDNQALLDGVNGFLAAFRAAKGFQALGDQWFKDEKAAFGKMGVSFLF